MVLSHFVEFASILTPKLVYIYRFVVAAIMFDSAVIVVIELIKPARFARLAIFAFAFMSFHAPLSDKNAWATGALVGDDFHG